MLTSVSVAMPLSWDFIDCWFASFGGVDQRQPEQGWNSGSRSSYSLADGQVLVPASSTTWATLSGRKRLNPISVFSSRTSTSVIARSDDSRR